MNSKLLIGLSVGLVVYVLVGGVVFNVIESSTESANRQLSLQKNMRWLEDHTCVHPSEFVVLVRRVLSEGITGAILAQNTTTATNWDIASAIFFATSAVTTIGYGPVSPQTSEGRVFLIFFTLLGIPLTLVTLWGLGGSLAHLSHQLPPRHRPALQSVLRLSILLTSGIILWLVVTAALFQLSEDTWSYWDAWYFMFITMTTIGFGDLLIGRTDVGELRYWYRPVVALWIILGLIWVAAVIVTCCDICRKSWESRHITTSTEGNGDTSTVYVVQLEDKREQNNVEVYELSSLSTIHRSGKLPRSARIESTSSLDRVCHSIKSVSPSQNGSLMSTQSQSGIPNVAYVLEEERKVKRINSVKIEEAATPAEDSDCSDSSVREPTPGPNENITSPCVSEGVTKIYISEISKSDGKNEEDEAENLEESRFHSQTEKETLEKVQEDLHVDGKNEAFHGSLVSKETEEEDNSEDKTGEHKAGQPILLSKLGTDAQEQGMPPSGADDNVEENVSSSGVKGDVEDDSEQVTGKNESNAAEVAKEETKEEMSNEDKDKPNIVKAVGDQQEEKDGCTLQ